MVPSFSPSRRPSSHSAKDSLGNMRVGQTRKRDDVEPAIRNGLRAFGATVKQLSGPGLGDLLVGYRGRWFHLEVKTGNAGFSKLQANAIINGEQCPDVVRTLDDA